MSWRAGFSLFVVCKNSNVMHVLFYPSDYFSSFLCSFLFDPPYAALKKQFLIDLATAENTYLGPWLLIGDFNVILHSYEKRGGLFFGSTSTSSGFHTLSTVKGLLTLVLKGKYSFGSMVDMVGRTFKVN